MYLEYYQLAQKPFQINTDPAFLWFGEKHKEALATLKYGILENKSFLLLTGDVGVGKTTIINALLEVLDKNDLVAVINDPMLDKLDFFTHIARAFGLSGNCTTKGHFLITFGNFLLEQHYQGKRILLIVDESQLLSHELLEEIRLFSNLEKWFLSRICGLIDSERSVSSSLEHELKHPVFIFCKMVVHQDNIYQRRETGCNSRLYLILFSHTTGLS